MDISFMDLANHMHKGNFQPPKTLLALDPGETTGAAVYTDGILTGYDQLDTKDINKSTDIILKAIQEIKPNIVVYEDYKVYGWKADSHSWAALHTPQLIGTIQTLCHIYRIPVFSQMAQEAKHFCTDKKLKYWDYWAPGMKHARDAIRHGAYFLLFNLAKVPSNKS